MSLKPKRVDFQETWHGLQETVNAVITLGKVPRSTWNDRFTPLDQRQKSDIECQADLIRDHFSALINWSGCSHLKYVKTYHINPDVYSLCVAYPEPLADKLYHETRQFLDNHVKSLLDKVVISGEASLLRNYYEAWTEYSQGINYLHRLYSYLNQQHIKKQKLSEAEIIYGNVTPDDEEQMEIGELGLEIWKRNMIEPLQSSLVKLLLEGIHQDRVGDAQSSSCEIIKGVIHSFVGVQEYKKKDKLELYRTVFEAPFLEATGEYYRREASKYLQECNVSQYMEKVTQRLNEESMRIHHFLHCRYCPCPAMISRGRDGQGPPLPPPSVDDGWRVPSLYVLLSILIAAGHSYNAVRAKCEEEMVAGHLSFLHSECEAMVVEERRSDLKNMYPLLHAVQSGLVVLVNHVMAHIKQQGLNAVTGLFGENMHVQFVESMLDVHKKYKQLIQDVFQSDQAFMGALDKACSSVINHKINPKQPCRSPELLAKYCDTLLKKSSKGLSESEIDDRLANSITIFKYIDDKDVFQKFYSRMLARRLIHQQCQSMDAEEAMINRLKQACGYEFTNKLHRMFTDISVSNDLNNKFSTFLKNDNIDLGINFSIYVLQAGAWPLGQANLTSFVLPQELVKSVQMFENFYHSHFSGRKLTWLHHLCQGELKLGYLKKPYIVTMQVFQMAILLLFESTETLVCSEIQNTLQLNADQFNKYITSLVDCKLLLSSTESINNDTVLSLNMEYTNKRTRLRITTAMQKESPQELEQTVTAVDEDRKLYLQAAIVRIMKSRKILRHNALIQEVLSQSKAFAPAISMIKKCIEALIDKQYIERTPNSSDEYSYVA